MAQYRQTVSAGGGTEDDEGDYWGGVWMALKDPFTYLFSAIHFSLVIAQSYKDFFPSVSQIHVSFDQRSNFTYMGLLRSSLLLGSVLPRRTSFKHRLQ